MNDNMSGKWNEEKLNIQVMVNIFCTQFRKRETGGPFNIRALKI